MHWKYMQQSIPKGVAKIREIVVEIVTAIAVEYQGRCAAIVSLWTT